MMVTMLFTTLVLIYSVHLSAGFIPINYVPYTLNTIPLPLGNSITHKDMSKAAVLDVAAAMLMDNPNPESEGSSSRISALQSLTEESLITAYYGKRQQSRTRTFRDVIKAINTANADVDLGGEKTIAAAHFDSEQIQAGHNRLVDKRRTIVAQILNSNFESAREETGRLFHTLQDFYSHSNWIENGNRAPYRVLGRSNERPSNIAGSTTQTCSDCDGARTFFDININFCNLFSLEYHPYVCRNNIVSSLLTTGYYTGQRNDDGVIAKPNGKCSHGGILDATSDQPATGGINKDSTSNILSPHYYLHEEAARVAQQATTDILQEIRSDVNNDALFGMYLGLNVAQDVSIAYVIDTTGSMAEELPEIQATIPRIRADLQQYVNSFSGNMQVRYILVPFNDPDPGILIETKDAEEFLAGIAALHADGGGDTPEPSIGAIIRAMEASEPGSPIYVFTDAPASDEHRRNEARSLILRTRARIYFALVNLRIGKRSFDNKQGMYLTTKRQVENEDIYEQLATISGGQFLNVRTSEISELASLVSFSAVQSRRTIFRQSSISHGTVVHSFPVDSSVVEVVLSINGQRITVFVTTPQGNDSSNIAQYSTSLVSTTSYIARINVSENSLRGEWRMMIQSQGSYNIQVLGSSELSFSEDLYSLDSCSYGFSKIEGRPSQGNPLVALIAVEGGSASVTVSGFNLVLSDSGRLLRSVNNLTLINQDSYVGAFMPPSEPFVLQLVGTDQNGLAFSHITDTSIEVSAVDLTLSNSDSGFVTLRQGETANITLVMLNHGEDADFNVAIMGSNTTVNGTNSLEYSVTPTTAFLRQNMSTEIYITIVLSGNITDGLTVPITVVAESVISSASNFITFSVITTTRPPPKFTENDSFNGAVMPTPLLLLEGMVIMGFLLLCYP